LRLEKRVLIGFRDSVIPQAQHYVLRMRHRLDSSDIYSLHLFDHSKDAPELLQNRIGFLIVDRDTGEAGSAKDVLACQGHESLNSRTLKRRRLTRGFLVHE